MAVWTGCPPANIGLKVLMQSVVFVSHTLKVPSLDAEMIRVPSKLKVQSFTNEVCPRKIFSVFPDFNP